MKLRKFAAALMACAVLVAAVPFSGCFKRGTESEAVDPNRTQVYVGNYNGGLGDTWLKNAKAAFEAKTPEVQIIINSSKDLYVETYLAANFAAMTEDVYVLDMVDYQTYVNRGWFADITDIVTQPMTEFGESESIEDKMQVEPTFIDYFKLDGEKYYALPYYKSCVNLVYNKEVFLDYYLYFKDGGGFITSRTDKKSVGADGEEGTYDDGLPVTMSDFKQLLSRMVSRGVTPIIWTGENQTYFNQLLTSVWFDYEGYENALMNYTLKGSYTFEGDSQPTPISYKNAYLLQKQTGKHYALEFMEAILSDSDYYRSECFDLVSHTSAQSKFLLSELTNDPVGMIVEGTWWETEARETFKSLVNSSGDDNDAYGVKEFGIMPIPKADDGSSADSRTLYGTSGKSLIAIRGNSKVMDWAKKFVQFLHTDEMLSMMTAETNVARPFDYTLSDTQLDTMTPYGREMWKLSKTSRFVYGMKLSDFSQFCKNGWFDYINWEFYSKIGTRTELFPQRYYKFTDPNIEAIFQGFSDYYDLTEWQSLVEEFEATNGVTE